MNSFALHDIEIEGYAALQLESADTRIRAIVVPALSMLTYSLCVDGNELLYQGNGLRDYARTRRLRGIPVLHPWANRLRQHGYSIAGTSVQIDAADPNLSFDANGLPIHGLLVGARAWQITARHADAHSAAVSAVFPFGAHPALLSAFPFPHDLTLAITLEASRLNFTTSIHAPVHGAPVPVAFGFHPYLRLPSPRTSWQIAMPAMDHLELDHHMIPTGSATPCAFPRAELGRRTFDDSYGGLAPGSRFLVEDRDIAVIVEFTTGYSFAQVYAPVDRDFICFEPMTAPTNALASGSDLRFVPPGSSTTAAWSILIETSH